MATPEEAAIDKMKAFIAGGACGNICLRVYTIASSKWLVG
tara:strand:- start:203 stop:322 length:120 start_codon:yes stop_codon:yes gene_type:complete